MAIENLLAAVGIAWLGICGLLGLTLVILVEPQVVSPLSMASIISLAGAVVGTREWDWRAFARTR